MYFHFKCIFFSNICYSRVSSLISQIYPAILGRISDFDYIPWFLWRQYPGLTLLRWQALERERRLSNRRRPPSPPATHSCGPTKGALDPASFVCVTDLQTPFLLLRREIRMLQLIASPAWRPSRPPFETKVTSEPRDPEYASRGTFLGVEWDFFCRWSLTPDLVLGLKMVFVERRGFGNFLLARLKYLE